MTVLDATLSESLLLPLYRASREMPETAFMRYALNSVKPLLGFQGAIWGTGSTDHVSITAKSAHLLNVDPAALEAWKRINGRDKAIPLGTGYWGHTFNFHVPTLFSAPEDIEFREYARRWKRKVHLGTGLPEPEPGALQWLSLYRYDDLLYTEQQRQLCQMLMPHFAEALRINRAILPRADQLEPAHESAGNALAIADFDGRIRHAQTQALQLLCLEWPEADCALLPAPLLRLLRGQPEALYLGTHIKVMLRVSADVLLLEASLLSAVDRLPVARAKIATMFAAGHSHKEIALRLRLSPSTVRNQLSAAYRTLGISSREQLIRLASLPGVACAFSRRT